MSNALTEPRKVPLWIKMRSWIYPIVNYQKEYPGSNTVNLARGEITMHNLSPERWVKDIWIGRRFVSSGRDEKGDYDAIEVYLGDGFFKLISKVYE